MRFRIALIGVLIVAAACSDSGSVTTTEPLPTASTTTTTVAATSTTTTTIPPLDRIREATVRVVARGTFIDPFFGVQANVPGSGSAFVIDPSGIAVTNNHVVTGAGIINVYVGDEVEPRNARVIGASECSDIAVLEISGDDEFVALDWYDGEVTAGLEVLAAGFPLGDPEYTLLDGIVSKENTDGDTSWASIDFVLEHTADTLPGNSGGPLVTADGEVVGVNYAGNDVGQAFAIAAGVARPTVDQIIQSGADVDSIGVNGEAIDDEVGGIWVYSVESGSPAERAGITGGDTITEMEGIGLNENGTMASYCDVLRSHGPEDVLAVEVFRSSDGATYEGQINGTELEHVADGDGDGHDHGSEGVVRAELPPGAPYFDIADLTDDSEAISVAAPAEWSDISGLPWEVDGAFVGPALAASPDLDAWFDGWETPGFFIGASSELGLSVEELLAEQDFSGACDYAGTDSYNDGFYIGLMDVWQNCGGAGSEFLVVVAEPPDGSYLVLVEIIQVTDADIGAADQIFLSFFVEGLAAG